MSIVAMIPIKSKSKRVNNKNFLLFNGLPLYEHFFKKLIHNKIFDDIYVDTDSEEISRCAHSYGFKVIERPEWLTRDSANGNDLLLYEAGIVKADYYIQLFITAPFLTCETIKNASNILINSDVYDSVLTVNEEYSWFWFNGKPVNYDPEVLPRSQDAQPIIRETTGLYAIRRDVLLKRKCRIGYKPYFLVVDSIEGADLDTNLDFYIAEKILEYKGE